MPYRRDYIHYDRITKAIVVHVPSAHTLGILFISNGSVNRNINFDDLLIHSYRLMQNWR